MVITQSQAEPIESGIPVDDTRAFRRALGQFATGVTVITTSMDDNLVGMTANSFSAVSLDPPLVLWSIRKESRSLEAFRDSGHFSINVLAENQTGLSELFGRPREEQFNQVEWTPGIFGDPLFPGVIAHLQCETHEIIDAGDHYILVGRVDNYARFEGKPLLFSQGQFGIPSSFPETSQTTDSTITVSSDLIPNNEQTIFLTLLKAADRHMSRLFQQHRQEVGVTVATGQVLNRLSICPDTVENLGKKSFLGENSVEDALIELAGQNLVAAGSNGEWEITDSGREVRLALRRSAEEFNAQQLKNISAEDLAAAQRVLQALVNLDSNPDNNSASNPESEGK